MLVYSREVPTGWIGFFRGGFELEVRTDLPRPMAYWSTIHGAPLGFARWGRA